MSDKKNEPAFPSMDMNSHMGVDRLELRYTGLTKREYLAAMAMQSPHIQDLIDRYLKEGWQPETAIAKASINLSDELLKHLDS